jgi:hypothetical protein
MKGGDPIAAITTGLPGQWSMDYIAGLLPAGWRLVHGPQAQPDLVGGVVLSVGADGPRGEAAGGRLAVGAERLAVASSGDRTKLIETLLAELGEELRRDAEAKAR